MKENKIYILIQDDTEILGSGQGHVMYRMYLPVIRYVEILKKYGIKSTFYIDMAHLLFLKDNPDIKDFGFQATLIEKIILHLLENDMEVQIHIHSQYVNAKIENDQIKVTKYWNIGQLKDEEQKHLINRAFLCLNAIIKKSGKLNPLISFKAGSWGLQPFITLYEEFKKLGINIVLGPTKSLKISTLDLDYSSMESDQYPYYCNKLDVTKIGTVQEGPIIAPMTPTYLNWIDLLRYLIQVKWRKFLKRYDEDLDFNLSSLNTKYYTPLQGKDKLSISFKPYQTHLKMNSQPFWFLKKTFERSYSTVLKNSHTFKLIVLETHTKDFKNTFQDIDKFFKYLTKKYENIEFITTSQLMSKIDNGTLKPLSKI